ncbi:MAG TPA: 2-dehydropantoate 2-reductase [Candidatus Limnocylindria bacterium]|nr:2-dehydropantoate 2-reductase [Candidatus Limnocylindria bacterium]
MRVAILGMGAIGQVIARALDGRAELVPVDRTKLPLKPGEAPVEAAIIAAKTPGTVWAAENAAKILAAEGVALTIQNGLGNYEVLVDRLGPARVAVGVIYVGAGFREDGTHYATGPGRIQLAPPPGRDAARRLDALVEALRMGGVEIEIVDDPWPAVWRKLVANAVVNAPSALLDASYGEILGDPSKALLCDGLARESARIVTAAGYACSEEQAMEAWRAIARAMNHHRSSMHADLARRRQTEVDAINGALVREAERRGIAAPLNQAMTLLVSSLSTV